MKKLIVFMILFPFLWSMGCKKKNSTPPPPVYAQVQIGTQVWMLRNLDVDKYRNGDLIPQVSDPAQWSALTTGAWCYYNNDPANGVIYGKLYNWYALTDPRGLAPVGWHISTDAEWQTMECYLGMSVDEAEQTGDRGIAQNVGGKLRSLFYWDAPNLGATNSSGFSALGSGYRWPDGDFGWFNQWTGFHTATVSSTDKHWQRYIGYDMQGVGRVERPPLYAYSVRCVKD